MAILLSIRIKKRRDDSAVLTCRRPDGSVTWQRQQGPYARFFPRHDLTHYAVESILQHRLGFYGLVAEGWDLSDFGSPWPRGPMPADADPSELIVGFLDAERATGTEWSSAELNAKVAQFFDTQGVRRPFVITDEQLSTIRKHMHALFSQWEAVVPGGNLELEFEIR